MLIFSEHYNLKESIWDSMKSTFLSIKNVVSKLKFGSKQVISFSKMIKEEYLTEQGWMPQRLGQLAELTAMYTLLNSLESASLTVDSTAVGRSKTALDAFKKNLKKELKDEVSSTGKPIPKSQIDSVSSEFDKQIKRGEALANRVFQDLIESQDAMISKFDVLYTAHSESKTSTADLVVEKKRKNEVVEQFRYSLKAYVTLAEKTSNTKGTSREPFGFLGMSLGFDQITTSSLSKISAESKKIAKVYGKQIPEYAKFNREVTKWVLDEETRMKKTPKWKNAKKGSARKEAKRRCAEKYGIEIRDYHINLWMKMFEIGLKKNGNSFKKAVLQALDLSPNSPALLSAHHDQYGKVNTYMRNPKSVSGDLKKLLESALKDIDIKVVSNTVPTPSNLTQLVRQKKLKQGPVYIVFYVSGVEVYRAYGEVKGNILLQMGSGGIGGKKSNKQVKFEIDQYLDSLIA